MFFSFIKFRTAPAQPFPIIPIIPMSSLHSIAKNFMVRPLIFFAIVTSGMAATKPIKLFILAGDENCLEQGIVERTSDGKEATFHPGENPAKDEQIKHVNCAVYQGAYAPGTDYDTLKPTAIGIVEIGDQRTVRRPDKKRGLLPVPMTPFPALAEQDGYPRYSAAMFRYHVQGTTGSS